MTSHQPFPDSSFGHLASFPLVWRWNQASHSVLPPDVMAHIRPFLPAAAVVLDAEAHSRLPDPYDRAGLRFDCGDGTSEGNVYSWLRSLSQDGGAWTVLSWDARKALLVPWEDFAKHWSDFCYPASDDVTIWQPGRLWTLAYEHHESFRYFSQTPVHAI